MRFRDMPSDMYGEQVAQVPVNLGHIRGGHPEHGQVPERGGEITAGVPGHVTALPLCRQVIRAMECAEWARTASEMGLG